jgi:hypothetical protein
MSSSGISQVCVPLLATDQLMSHRKSTACG